MGKSIEYKKLIDDENNCFDKRKFRRKQNIKNDVITNNSDNCCNDYYFYDYNNIVNIEQNNDKKLLNNNNNKDRKDEEKLYQQQGNYSKQFKKKISEECNSDFEKEYDNILYFSQEKNDIYSGGKIQKQEKRNFFKITTEAIIEPSSTTTAAAATTETSTVQNCHKKGKEIFPSTINRTATKTRRYFPHHQESLFLHQIVNYSFEEEIQDNLETGKSTQRRRFKKEKNFKEKKFKRNFFNKKIEEEENNIENNNENKKTKFYDFMKNILNRNKISNTNNSNIKKIINIENKRGNNYKIKKFNWKTEKINNKEIEENYYVELPNIKVINNNLGVYPKITKHFGIITGYNNNSSSSNDNHIKKKTQRNMQDIKIRMDSTMMTATTTTTAAAATTTMGTTLGLHDCSANNINHHHHHHHHHQHNRPIHLFTETNLDDSHDNDSEPSPRSQPSSEEDNSPTEMNNCRRLLDKPPLVKRLTMGFLRSTEDSYPLVHNNTTLPSDALGITKNLSQSQTIILNDGYVNSTTNSIETEKIISSKFGNSCRKSLTTLPSAKQFNDDEFNLKLSRKYLRETSSANSSPKIYTPNWKQNNLSCDEQNELKGAAWYQVGLPREISLEILSRKNPGAFLVRQSSTKPGCFALSLRVPPPGPKVAHYLILRTMKGYKIKGFTKEFTSLRALITHHSVMPELLPVPLSLPRPSRVYDSSRRNLDDFDTYDSLNDFRKQMADMNI